MASRRMTTPNQPTSGGSPCDSRARLEIHADPLARDGMPPAYFSGAVDRGYDRIISRVVFASGFSEPSTPVIAVLSTGSVTEPA